MTPETNLRRSVTRFFFLRLPSNYYKPGDTWDKINAPGDEVEVEVLRGDQTLKVKVQLTERH